MAFMDEFRQSRDAMLGGTGLSSGGTRAALEDRTPTPIQFGYYLDRKTGRTGIPLLCETALHLVLFGLNGAGKQTRFLNRLYMTARGRSMFIVETKGTAALQTAHERRKFSDTKVICPIPVLGLESNGFNPLRHLNAKSPDFLGDARALARAMIDMEAGTGKHWSESATGLVTAMIMWEVILAEREKRAPSLLYVRMMLTEPDRWEEYAGRDGRQRKRLVAGLQLTAARMIDEGGPIIRSLVGRFLREHGKDEIASIQSTADTQTQFLLNEHIAADLSKGDDVDLTQLSQRLMSVYVVCAASDLPEYRRWIRMVLSFALRAQLSRPPRHTCLYSLDEYRATIGQLDLVKDDWALVREHGVQFLVCTQSALHLKTLHGDEWQDFVGQAGAFATVGPPGDEFTAEFMSKRCGMRTVLKKGFNIGEGINSGGSANSGTSFAPGGQQQ
jgi:type IV secretory pathway TraG/TraD family ATPase VirD4